MIQRKAKEPTQLTMISTSLSFSLASTGFCKIGWYCEKNRILNNGVHQIAHPISHVNFEAKRTEDGS